MLCCNNERYKESVSVGIWVCACGWYAGFVFVCLLRTHEWCRIDAVIFSNSSNNMYTLYMRVGTHSVHSQLFVQSVPNRLFIIGIRAHSAHCIWTEESYSITTIKIIQFIPFNSNSTHHTHKKRHTVQNERENNRHRSVLYEWFSISKHIELSEQSKKIVMEFWKIKLTELSSRILLLARWSKIRKTEICGRCFSFLFPWH